MHEDNAHNWLRLQYFQHENELPIPELLINTYHHTSYYYYYYFLHICCWHYDPTNLIHSSIFVYPTAMCLVACFNDCVSVRTKWRLAYEWLARSIIMYYWI